MNKKILYFLILGLLSFFLAGPAFVAASPASSTYNFTQPGHWAGDMAGSPGNPDDGNLATASAANYDNIKSDDSNYWETAKASNNNQYDSQVYRFYINEDEGSVTQITPLWNGHSDEVRTNYDLSLLIWNYDTTGWETVQSDSDGSTTDIDLTAEFTNPGPYIDTDKEIALWARFENYKSGACPTIYSVDREGKEVLEEETILGLINKRMEKYHYEDLEYAQAQDGKLKIIVKEERPEITFLNDIKLIVIDSQAKQVLIAPDGSPQTINNLQPVISCKSKRGEDCLKQVLKQDSKLDQTLPVDEGGGINFRENWRQTAWTTSHPQLLDFSKKENLRDWIEVELPPAPADAKTAKLVISASETGILSFAEVDWITTSKENVELFFDLSDNTIFGDHWAKNLYKVVPPKIQIQNDKGEWVNYPDSSFDENIFSTYDTLVFPLDLSLIENNKVRIESMAYTYIYDFVGVDYSDVDYTKYIISPTAATYKGENILEEINNLDDKRLLLLPYEQTELLFRLPQENQSLNRSYHIQIAGYYQPERRMKGKGISSFKSILTQIEKDGLFKFAKRTNSELYDLIMTCSTFNYPNRRFLTKFLRALEKKGIDPDKTFPFSPTSVDSLYTDYVEVKITYNSPPTVGTINISPSSMTPQEEWTTITVPVTDADTLADVNKVHVEVFYDSTGNDTSAPGTANVQTCAILTWTRGDSPVWDIAPASTTWAINTGGCSAGDDNLTTDDWVFSFKVGKVATQSSGSDNWDIYAKATDSAGQTGDNYLRDVEMNWYGEITVNTGTVDWGVLAPGTDFGDSTKQTDISVTYICNGNYNKQVKASSPWNGTGTNQTTLNGTGNPGSGEFSLKADNNATVFSDDFESGNLNNWTSAPSPWTVTTSGVYQGAYSGYASGSQGVLSKTLPSMSTGFIELKAKFGETNKHHYPIYNSDYILVAKSDGHFGYYNGSVYKNLPIDTTYSANVWYDCKAYIDLPNDRYKIFIDGQDKGWITDNAQVNADSDLSPFSVINAVSGNTGTIYIDLYKVRRCVSLTDAELVLSTDYTTIDTGFQTSEAGNVDSSNTLWLSLGSGIPVDTYTGTLYFRIAP